MASQLIIRKFFGGPMVVAAYIHPGAPYVHSGPRPAITAYFSYRVGTSADRHVSRNSRNTRVHQEQETYYDEAPSWLEA